jgi:hypothetical protein
MRLCSCGSVIEGYSRLEGKCGQLAAVQEEAAAPFVRLIALLVRQEGAQVAEYINDFKVRAQRRLESMWWKVLDSWAWVGRCCWSLTSTA